MHLDDSNVIRPETIFKKSLAQIVVGVNDKCAFRPESNFSGTEIDISKIGSAINEYCGDTTIFYTIGLIYSESFKTEKNTLGRAILLQSFSNRYVQANSERFCKIPIKDLDDDEWKKSIQLLAGYLMGALEQESVTYTFEDLPTGTEVEVHTYPAQPPE